MNGAVVPPLLATLFERLQSKESLELEFKSAQGGLPKSLWPTISAFANTSGGWIVLGVSEHGGELTLEGIANPDGALQTFHDLLRNPQKISNAVCGPDDVSVEPMGDRSVVVIRIPAESRRMRPVYINGNPYNGTFVRRNSGDYQCVKQEVDRMIREASDVATDSTILTHFDLNDLDREALVGYRQRYQNHDPASPWNAYDDRRFLQAVGGFRRDRETGNEGITVAGLLMFGAAEALREWRSRHLIDYRLESDAASSDDRWNDRIAWEGNLLGAFDVIYSRLVGHPPVPSPFRLEGSTRIDQGPYHVAVREALVNLLVHADYTETQASLIKRSPQGFFFRNPGSSRVSEADLLTGDRSDPRNPLLVLMFRLIGLADEAGTGFPKIIKTWRDLGFHLPLIDVGTERYEFALDLRYVHLLSDDDRIWLQSLGTGWSEAEQIAMVYARHDGEVDNSRLRTLTGLHPADATKVLSGLRARGLFQVVGSGRAARYQLGPAASPEQALQLTYVDGADSNLGGTGLSSEDKATDSEGMGLDSEVMGPNSEDTALSFEDTRTVSERLWAELLDMSKMAREQRRLTPSIRDSLLVQLCARAPLSLHELASLLGRSEAYIREALRPLIAAERLAFFFPNHPNHPRQKYVAKAPNEMPE